MAELSLQEALRQFLQQSRLQKGIQALQVEDVWEEVVGKTIAKYTDKIQVAGHTLFVSTSVAPLKTELVYQKEKIIQQLNERLGEKLIRDLVVR